MENAKPIIDQLVSQWDIALSHTTKVFDSLGHAHAETELAPGRNSVIYLLGHMVAVHDRMIEALEAGERMFPELDGDFLESADKKKGYPPYSELLAKWKAVNGNLSAAIQKQSVADWLSKHHYVSTEDFTKEPHRNRLAILISRYAHLNTHLGQLRL
ncbi:MAG: hypothetical protein JWM28_3526, partial [Chitinophagaceae bacterium]|nr:hypothetical protein [Chitinophagaceae bacterium]